MRRALEIAGSMKAGFFLFAAAAAVMFIGSMYANGNYEVVNALNGARVQDYLRGAGRGRLDALWWVIALFAVFALLAVNAVACTTLRIRLLWSRRGDFTSRRFLTALSPSIIHLLFVLMLLGHFVSFTAVEQRRLPLREGARLSVGPLGAARVAGIEHRHFRGDSPLRGRVSRSRVVIALGEKGEDTAALEFLRPVYRGGWALQLDMEKQKRQAAPGPSVAGQEDRSREHQPRDPGAPGGAEPKLLLVATRDPGIYILFPCFTLLISLMAWYFYQVLSGKNAGR